MTRTHSRLRRTLLCAIAVTAAVPFVAAADAPPASAATVKPRVSLLGDSTMMAMNDADRNVVRGSYDLLWDAQSCRRLVSASCRGRFGSVPVSVLPLIRTSYRGSLGEAMVLMAGYDDFTITSAIDSLMAEATTQGVARVVFLTFREHVPYRGPNGVSNAATFARHNADLRAAAAKYPSLHLADWNTYSAAHSEWFYSDGIHLTPAGSRALSQFIVAELDALTVGRCTNAATGTPIAVPADRPVNVGPANGFTSRQPIRVLDTRDPALGGANGMLAAGRVISVPVAPAIDDSASAVVATVTAVDPCRAGFLTAYPGPCSTPPPLAATVNFVVGRTTANMAVTALGNDTICVYSSTASDVVVDVMGWVGTGGSRFNAITPQRFVDTRGGAGVVSSVSGRRGSHVPTTIPVAGRGNVPADADSVLVNLTAVQPDVDGFVSLYPGPCDGAVRTSTVNAIGGRDTGAATIVGIGSDGSICAHSSMGTDIVLDVQAWFGAGGLRYRAQTPQRVLDTRTGGAAPSGAANIPSATPALLNVVADQPTQRGFVRAAGCGDSTDTSMLNFPPGEITGNVAAIAPKGTSPAICLGSSWPVHLVADLSGTFVS